ncbi:MAG: GlsB/YeaQ/YmgE family stress response membrane protein [Planctomycetota bacterium]
MHLTLPEFIVWLIVGALAGSAIGAAVTRRKKGFGPVGNLGLGMAGALIGTLLFQLFGIDLGLSDVAVKLSDFIAAVLGSILLLVGMWVFRNVKRVKPAPPASPPGSAAGPSASPSKK